MTLLELGLEEIQREIVVPPKGSPQAKIVIVCEAPGVEEGRKLDPLAGRGGLLLKKLLLQAGIAMTDTYITHVIKVCPPKNELKPFFFKGKFTEKGELWVKVLKEELEGTTANVIVAVGAVALAALCFSDSILKWRGSMVESTLLPGRKVIPTINPNSALRQYIQRYYITTDLIRSLYQSNFPEIRRPKRNLIINPSCEQALQWFDKHKDLKRVCIDIEISGQLQVSCISFCYHVGESMSIPVMHYTLQEELVIWKRIAEIIGDPEIMMVGQNIAFDLFFILFRYHIIPRGFIGDTMIAHNIMYPDFNKGLDFLCSVYTDEPYYKGEGKEWKVVKDWEMFWRYNAKDTDTTLEIWEILEPRMKAGGYWPTYLRTEKLHYPLFFMMFRGMHADPEGIKEVKESLVDKIIQLQNEIDEIVKKKDINRTVRNVDTDTGTNGYLNVNSPKQLQEYFYGFLGIKPYLHKKKPTCNDKALQRLAKGTATRAGLREASLIQQLVGLKKFRGTYLGMEFDSDSRFRCTFNPRGTIFGRLSSSKTIFHTGMNMQNLDPRFKGFLKADPGYALIEMDKVQAEWVATAYISGDPQMIRVVESGVDSHASTAQLITGMPIDIILEEHKLLKHASNPDEIQEIRKKFALADERVLEEYRKAIFIPRSMSLRQCGKKSNHAFDYGMGPTEFALQNETSNQDALQAYNGYHRAYRLRAWFQTIQYELGKNRTLYNCYGRKIKLLGPWDDPLYQQAYSFKPQSTVGDLTNDMVYDIYHSPDPAVQLIELLGNIHDSVLFQIPLSAGVEKIMEAIYKVKVIAEPTLKYNNREFIIQTDIKIGPDWGNMKELSLEKPDEIQLTLEEMIYEPVITKEYSV